MAAVDSPQKKTCFDFPRATCNLTQDVVGMPALCGIAPPALQLTSGLTIVRGVTALVRGYDDVTQKANDVWKKVNGGLYIFRGFCDFVAGPINTFIAIAKNFAKWSPAALPVLNTIASIATAVSLVGLAVQCGIDLKDAKSTKDKFLSIALGVTASLLAVTILLGDILTVGGISKGLSIANFVLGLAFCIFDGLQLRDGLKATDQTKKEMLFKLMMVGATVLLSAGIFAAGQFLTGGTLPIILRIATMAVPIITTSIFCRENIAKGCAWLKQKITPLSLGARQTAVNTNLVAAVALNPAPAPAPAAAAATAAAATHDQRRIQAEEALRLRYSDETDSDSDVELDDKLSESAPATHDQRRIQAEEALRLRHSDETDSDSDSGSSVFSLKSDTAYDSDDSGPASDVDDTRSDSSASQ